MKSIFKFRTALSVALCVMFALTLFTACEIDEPSKDERDGYVGTYRVAEEVRYMDGTKETDNYTITITKSEVNKSNLVITNILNSGAGVQVLASVDGDNFTIGQQTITLDGIGAGLSGSGTRTGNTLHFSVLATLTGIGQANFTCDATKM
jgi:hypothetical protein